MLLSIEYGNKWCTIRISIRKSYLNIPFFYQGFIIAAICLWVVLKSKIVPTEGSMRSRTKYLLIARVHIFMCKHLYVCVYVCLCVCVCVSMCVCVCHHMCACAFVIYVPPYVCTCLGNHIIWLPLNFCIEVPLTSRLVSNLF